MASSTEGRRLARCSETLPQCDDLLPPVKTENSNQDKSGAPSGQLRKSDQSFSVASFAMPLPTGLCFLRCAAQSTLGGLFGVAGKSFANVSPFRVMVICSPCSIHLASRAK